MLTSLYAVLGIIYDFAKRLDQFKSDKETLHSNLSYLMVQNLNKSIK